MPFTALARCSIAVKLKVLNQQNIIAFLNRKVWRIPRKNGSKNQAFFSAMPGW